MKPGTSSCRNSSICTNQRYVNDLILYRIKHHVTFIPKSFMCCNSCAGLRHISITELHAHSTRLCKAGNGCDARLKSLQSPKTHSMHLIGDTLTGEARCRNSIGREDFSGRQPGLHVFALLARSKFRVCSHDRLAAQWAQDCCVEVVVVV